MATPGGSIEQQLAALLGEATPEQIREFDKQIGAVLGRTWTPQEGPQTVAFFSPADVLLYGGAAGGGKTDLVIGLALEAERAVIFRGEFKDMRASEDRLKEIVGARGFNGSLHFFRRPGNFVEFGAISKPGSEKGWQGQPHDLIAADEVAQRDPRVLLFLMSWNRSASGRRCRVVFASNPPLGSEGLWLIEWFAPWVDPMFPKPAKPGELRWCIARQEGDDIRTEWIEEDLLERDDVGRFIMENGHKVYALSRTFIPAKLDDNRFLSGTDYASKITTIEPFASALRHGNFLAARKDAAMQVISTASVVAANNRWIANREKKLGRMQIISADVAQGGSDNSTVAALHGLRFDEIRIRPGVETPDGPSMSGFILEHRRDGAAIVVDLTGGWGGSTRDHLKTHHRLKVFPFVASKASGSRTRDQQFSFYNLRSEAWWKFREALEAGTGEDVELPLDSRLLAELTAPTYKIKGEDAILVESKQDIKKRIGGSTDKADAVIQAWFFRKRAEFVTGDYSGGGGKRDEAPALDPFLNL